MKGVQTVCMKQAHRVLLHRNLINLIKCITYLISHKLSQWCYHYIEHTSIPSSTKQTRDAANKIRRTANAATTTTKNEIK